jgi:hypothetical protein
MPPSHEIQTYRLADAGWFSTQPAFGLSSGTGCFDAPSFRDPRTLPAHFQFVEASYLLLAACTLAVARKNRDGLVFLGLLVLGTCLEVLGVTFTHAHMHPRFALHFLGFLPLKEMLWYPLTIYPSVLAARQMALGLGDEALLVGVLQTMQVIQYESMAYRRGIQLVAGNPGFLLGNVQDKITAGPWLNVYANWAIAVCGALLSRLAKDSRWNPAAAVCAIGLGGFGMVGAIGFMPLNYAKALGCYFGDIGLVPADAFRFEDVFRVYSTCVRTSPMTESWILLLCLLVSCLWVLAAAKHKSARNAPAPRATRFAWFAVASPLTYHLILGWVILRFDEEIAPVPAMAQWLCLAVASVGLSWLCVWPADEPEKQ